MLSQTTSLGFILKYFLHNDARNAILFAGVLLLVAAAATLFIKGNKPTDNTTVTLGAPH